MKDIINHYLKHIPMPTSQKEANPLKFCSKCETVWEHWYCGKRYFTKHSDMPTYRLKREDCFDCKED